jgi:predicted transcriptional regulator of viral defense system
MQPMKSLLSWLQKNAKPQNYLFSFKDLRVLCPELSEIAFKTLLSRAVERGHLGRVCRGLYTYPKDSNRDGLLLFRAASYLRSHHFKKCKGF